MTRFQRFNRLLVLGGDPKAQAMEPGHLVRALRCACKMSQAQLAKRAGLTQGDVSRVENGRTDPRVGTLRRLLAAMFCELVLAPRPLKRPGDALCERADLKAPYPVLIPYYLNPPKTKLWND